VAGNGLITREMDIDVLTAARQRIAWTFDSFPRIYLSGPSGKDSSVMMHLVCHEARARGRRVGVLYVDLEGQYAATIDHVREMYQLYSDVIDPHWVALPLRLRNAVSALQPYWVCWDPYARDAWVRQPPPEACTDAAAYPFHEPPKPPVDGQPREAMEFEEFVERFGHWYGNGEACACLVGIRAQESLNRWRAIAKRRKSRIEDKPFTAWKGGRLVNVYPVYDWRTEDVWTFVGRTKLPHNRIYDGMHKAGLTIHQMRICQPYGDDQRRGLNLFHVLEPLTWTKIVARVNGANQGALYAGKRGNILGNGKVALPDGHTWESFVGFLLDSLPHAEAEHYRDKIAVFIRWWQEKRGLTIVDCADPKLEAKRKVPSWRRVAKVILRNDFNCKGLSFSQQKSVTYERYAKLMQRRRAQWGIYAP
jgi:predicted phosphoadenosine phosphosulfate sulfurtransferase